MLDVALEDGSSETFSKERYCNFTLSALSNVFTTYLHMALHQLMNNHLSCHEGKFPLPIQQPLHKTYFSIYSSNSTNTGHMNPDKPLNLIYYNILLSIYCVKSRFHVFCICIFFKKGRAYWRERYPPLKRMKNAY